MTRQGLFCGIAVMLVSSLAGASLRGGWQEAHQTSDDVRIAVGADGVALVTHHLRWRIVAGKFKSLDVSGIDPRAEVSPTTTAMSEKGVENAAHVEASPKTPGSVHVALDDPKGIGRGSYVFDVSYKLDLVSAKMLVPDAAMARLTWTSPPYPEGHDGARVVLVLPPGPTEPRLASPDQAETTLVTLRRSAEHDELELVRAHVPRGEAAVWAARVDPKAFASKLWPEAAKAKGAAAPEDDRARTALVVLFFAGLAGALAHALTQKRAKFAADCEARVSTMRPLLRLPLAPFAYGLFGTGALAALLFGTPLHGAVLAVIAMGLAAHRAPLRLAKPRGPGRWATVSDASLVAPKPAPDALDVTTKRGFYVALGLVFVSGAIAFGLRTRIPGAQIAIPLFLAVLVPLFATGIQSQLPRSPTELAGSFFRPVRDALGRLTDLSHIELRTMARVREGTRSIDEVRLACLPGDPLPGLRAIEVAVAEGQPEVLVRWTDGSPASVTISRLAPGMRIVPGRVPEEKVLRLVPIRPTAQASALLVCKLMAELEGRRRGDRKERPMPYRGPERRLVPLAA